jgi:cob(I)alamin adenosyltransferase
MSDKYSRSMAKQQKAINASMAKATTKKSLLVFLTGDGKGKTSSGFGMIFRALGWGQKVAVVQFIKGVQASGEELLVTKLYPQIRLIQMGTGFTWDSQNFDLDKAAAEKTWHQAVDLLQDTSLDLLLLDELTYMLAYKFLEESVVINALIQRSPQLNVVVTGRGGGTRLREISDTVSEVKNIKHAYEAGVIASKGVDY